MNIDVIGDIHGCFDEFKGLTEELGYCWDSGIPLHPDGRLLAFVGDLTDRGPQSLKVIEVVSKLVKRKKAFYSPGNHCNKLYRYFLGRDVSITHGLETTVAEYKALNQREQEHISSTFIQLYEHAPLYQVLDKGKLVVAHAGIREEYIGRNDKRVKSFVLYGDITGKFHSDGYPVRRNWAKDYHGKAIIVYGHTPVKDVVIQNHTYNIDTGCVFGGKLTALRYPEMEIVDVPSSMEPVPEKFRELDK
ncbi:bis(5'-nucleosyl)-tetraphosphatase PrpE [Bacillus testis]|uniref:bis(5'-nucleosyl)-tetraphosphatase PrpE n=1 Tax=Bacillus testis TaxID=1622072 RepID=UPI00067EF221|nr:bis(5'-nucleosyl)-tetraphosphatase PrpE [Bacillus testis]